MKRPFLWGVLTVAFLSSLGPVASQVPPDPKTQQPSLDPPHGAVAPAAQIQLTAEQRVAIADAVRQAGTKAKAPPNVPATVGAQVPPVIELYVLPDRALSAAPEAKGVKYTLVDDQVVLVDPTTMRVVDVIRQ
jgi:hypothetical protein